MVNMKLLWRFQHDENVDMSEETCYFRGLEAEKHRRGNAVGDSGIVKDGDCLSVPEIK